MGGKVKTLCEFENVQLPKELLTAEVDMAAVEKEMANLSLRYANLITAETAQNGDIVYCNADNGAYSDNRTVLLFTGVEMPAAEKAVKLVLGKSVGFEFTTLLGRKTVTLTVSKIIRPVPAEVNDQLIKNIGIDGVSSVEQYRKYVTEKNLADIKAEKHKMAVSVFMDGLIEGSTFEYNISEIDEYIDKYGEEIKSEYAENGMEVPSDEDLRDTCLDQFKQSWAAKEYCNKNNIKINKQEVETEAEQMMEMLELMGEKVPSKEQLIEESLRNAYIMELFAGIDKFVSEKLGG